MNILGRARTVYQASRDINVRYDSQGHACGIIDRLPQWQSGSVYVFDKNLNLLLYNNKYGTLVDASSDDLKSLETLTRYMIRYYPAAESVAAMVYNALTNREPMTFTTLSADGIIVRMSGYPVPDNSGSVGGVVLVAERIHAGRTQVQGGQGCQRIHGER